MIAGPSAFISHADEDAVIAYDLCRHLERAGVPCWIAPRDVTPGQDYASEIVVGIESCSAFVLVLSAAANRSAFVRREVERAASKGKPMFPVRIEDVLPERALEFFVSSSHWIDAAEEPRDAHWERIARAIKGEREQPGDDGTNPWPTGRRDGKSWRRRALVGAGVLGVALLAGLWLMPSGDEVGRDSGRPPGTDPGARPSSDAAPAMGGRVVSVPTPARPDAAPSATDAATDRAGVREAVGPCPQSLAVSPDLATPFSCLCDAGATRGGTVWGTDRYTDDSAVCRAAVHAGAIPLSGGQVTVLREAGRDLYVGTSRHGVRSSDYGAWPKSIHFVGGVAPRAAGAERCPERFSANPDLPSPLTCVCAADDTRGGTVWGSDIYTSDSQLCRAALHAGAISAEGGKVTVERLPGRDIYPGTRRRGVSTHDYGHYPGSIHFAGTPQAPDPEPCPHRLSINPDLATPFSCVCSSEEVRDGTVWGTDLYTADSAICRAALHAGKVTSEGGTVTVEYLDGRDLYVGSRRNGVGTHDFGRYAASIAFR